MKIKISPSFMCCKSEDIKKYVYLFEKNNIDSIHFDVMDGHFVDNVTLGTGHYEELKKLTKIPIDLHFMVTNPENFINFFNVYENDMITFHIETAKQPFGLMQKIKKMGCKAGIAISPGTSVCILEEYINFVDFVNVMTVNPGFAGQTMTANSIEKISKVKKLLNTSSREIDLAVDGNTSFENSIKMRNAGANVFIAGTSSLITNVNEFEENYKKYVSSLKKF